VVLGIALSRSETFVFVRLFGVLAIVLLMLLIGSIMLWESTPVHQRFFTMLLFGLFVMVALFVITRYTLLGFFKTKHSLDFLIRETLHELNVPLSVIKANLHMLQSSETDTKRIQRLNRIGDASDDLYRLYEDVEYYIRCEIRSSVEASFELDETIERVIEGCKPLAQDTRVEYERQQVTLFGDRRGFVKVISNLLSNALKYNHHNVPIRIYYEAGTLVIEDKGIGMSEADLFLVFDRYYQADASKEGYGIGLSLVKAYCDECKILFAIESKFGLGTKVSLDLSRLIRKNAIID